MKEFTHIKDDDTEELRTGKEPADSWHLAFVIRHYFSHNGSTQK